MTQSNQVVDRFKTLCVKKRLNFGGLSPEDLGIILTAVAQSLPKDTPLREVQVNAAVRTWLDSLGEALVSDHVEIRRTLVDYHLLIRDASGTEYRVTASWPEKWQHIYDQLQGIDLALLAQETRTTHELERLERKRRFTEKNSQSH